MRRLCVLTLVVFTLVTGSAANGSFVHSIDVEDYGGGRYFLGVGWGVRYSTPVGPLRLDMGFNPDRASGEDLFVIHFALGFPF